MYCRLRAIGGLLQDKKLADQALTHATHEKAIILWTLPEADRIYGQCNFMREPQDSANFKFCDTFTTVVHKDMEVFQSMGVTQLLFVEEKLMERFKEDLRDGGLEFDLRLVPDPAD
jgi:hypothetical protein